MTGRKRNDHSEKPTSPYIFCFVSSYISSSFRPRSQTHDGLFHCPFIQELTLTWHLSLNTCARSGSTSYHIKESGCNLRHILILRHPLFFCNFLDNSSALLKCSLTFEGIKVVKKVTTSLRYFQK